MQYEKTRNTLFSGCMYIQLPASIKHEIVEKLLKCLEGRTKLAKKEEGAWKNNKDGDRSSLFLIYFTQNVAKRSLSGTALVALTQTLHSIQRHSHYHLSMECIWPSLEHLGAILHMNKMWKGEEGGRLSRSDLDPSRLEEMFCTNSAGTTNETATVVSHITVLISFGSRALTRHVYHLHIQLSHM